MKTKYIKELKSGDLLSNVPFAVLKVEKKLAKSGKDYCDVTLGDRSGSMLGRIWSEKFEATMCDKLTEGMVVNATGQVTEYQGKLQLILTMCTPSENFDDEDFIPISSRDIEEMFKELHQYINEVGDVHMKGLLKNIFADTELVEVFKKTPAAMRMHHAYKGGLLEHVLEVLAFAQPMFKLYQPANKDLVITGIILHDIGKVEEIIWKNLSIEYSAKGKLLGHVTIALEMIDKYKPTSFDGECERLLKHIILAHHGKLEFGAQVIPSTIEAKIVSLADDASAKLRGYKTMIDGAVGNGSDFSEYNKAIETTVYVREYASKTVLVTQPELL